MIMAVPGDNMQIILDITPVDNASNNAQKVTPNQQEHIRVMSCMCLP